MTNPPESSTAQAKPSAGDGSAPAPDPRYSCSNCGAEIAFQPGTDSLKCPYCGTANEIAPQDHPIVENDFEAELARVEAQAETADAIVLHCNACAAQVNLPPNVTSSACPFCGTPVVATGRSIKLIKPKAVLPFEIDEKRAREMFRKWIASLWFAPGPLKDQARIDASLAGVYVPYWTYDCTATTQYTGMRGDDYWTTETYTTIVNGKPRTATRQVKRTRWTPAAGTVTDRFDDVLVSATASIARERLEALEPWDTDKLMPYNDGYLAGFRAEAYAVTLRDGFGHATERMQGQINATIRASIGGDQQRITGKRSAYRQITYKHILLPVWVFAYRWNNTPYQILVNARTGEVLGERPWSAWKIAAAVLAGAAVIAVIAIVASLMK